MKVVNIQKMRRKMILRRRIKKIQSKVQEELMKMKNNSKIKRKESKEEEMKKVKVEAESKEEKPKEKKREEEEKKWMMISMWLLEGLINSGRRMRKLLREPILQVIIMRILLKGAMAIEPMEFMTGIYKTGTYKIADSSEYFDFITPVNIDIYYKAEKKMVVLCREYDRARIRYHKKSMKPSEDLMRDMILLKIQIEDWRRLMDLTPNFNRSTTIIPRKKRQILPIVTGLAGFIFGNILGSGGGDSTRIDEVANELKLFSEKNLEFQEAQIKVTNELSRRMVQIEEVIDNVEDNFKTFTTLQARKDNIKSIISAVKGSVRRMINLIKGALNGQIGTLVEHPEELTKAVKIVEDNNRSKAYVKNLGSYARISQVKIFREGSTLIIRDRIMIPLEDRIKMMQNYMPIWVTSSDSRQLVRPRLPRKSVIIDKNLTIEVEEKDYKDCVEISDIKVCKQVPNIFHAPGKNDCISKVALKRSMGEIQESCVWDKDTSSTARVTKVDENTFVIAAKEDSSILMDCEDREGIEYLEMKKGNNILNARSNCLVKEEGMDSQFAFRTIANKKNVPFKILNVNATFVDPYESRMGKDIKNEEKEVEELINEEIGNKRFNDEEIINAIEKMNSTYNENKKRVKEMKENLRPQTTWDYILSSKIAAVLIITIILSLITLRLIRKQKRETMKQEKEIIDLKEIPETVKIPPILIDRTGKFGIMFQKMPKDIQGMLMLAVRAAETHHDLGSMMYETVKTAAAEKGIKIEEKDMPAALEEYYTPKAYRCIVQNLDRKL